MTIEPPLALNGSTVGNSESMCPEGVAYPIPYVHSHPQQMQQNIDVQRQCINILLPPPNSYVQGLNQSPDTPEQYSPDLVSIKVASPSSSHMYEQDVSDMQQTLLLSPGSSKGQYLTESFGSQTSIAPIPQGKGMPEFMDDCRPPIDDLEISFNLEGMMSHMAESRYPIKSEPAWSPPVLDTGQMVKFKAEDVMMSHNVNQGPTLAELNEMDSSFFDDITSIIRNDPILNMNKTQSQQLPLANTIQYDSQTGNNNSEKLRSADKSLSNKMADFRNNPLAISIPTDSGNNNNSNLVQNKNMVLSPGNLMHSPGMMGLPMAMSPTGSHLSPPGTQRTSTHPQIETLLRGASTRNPAASSTIPRFTTCTITSPVQEVPTVVATTIVKTEPLSPTVMYTHPVFSIVNVPSTTPFVDNRRNSGSCGFAPSSATPFLLPSLTTLDKPSLQKLLAPAQPTVIKKEIPVVENSFALMEQLHRNSIKNHRKLNKVGQSLPISVQSDAAYSTLISTTTPKKESINEQEMMDELCNNASTSRQSKMKRGRSSPGHIVRSATDSPDDYVAGGSGLPRNGSTSSLTRKWEEIKQYLEAEEAGIAGAIAGAITRSSASLDEPVAKKIKAEHTDVAYNPIDELTSPPGHDFQSDSDSDLDADISDTESVGSHSSFVEELLIGGKKEKRYFWQYNTQAKGPKGKRLCKTVETHDPHILNNFEDPVFDPDINDAKYKHNGRARKGDGNDITPSPYKLFQIGNQLKRLTRKIHEITPANETAMPTKNKTRREKNKYASRACRLKKKAQHEANKIKLYGLDTEHTQLMTVLDHIRNEVFKRVTNGNDDCSEPLTSELDGLMKTHLSVMVAGNTADYVNSVLEHVVSGDKTGGLNLC